MTLVYDDSVVQPHRVQFCPMCREPLTRSVLFDDNIPRVHCSPCGWIQMIQNTVCVAVVAHYNGQIAVITPPGEDGVGLPAGMVEYGEEPKAAAVREVFEETGLSVTITDELGSFFVHYDEWPGPTIYFLYEAEIESGELRGSEEGAAKFVSLADFPKIATGREGSHRAMAAFRAKYS